MSEELSSASGQSVIEEPDTAFDPAEIAANLADIRQKISVAGQEAGRPEGRCQLVAVSKFHSADKVTAALAAGQTVFGENRVQEAQSKFPQLRESHPDLKLHLIGPLQTNKADQAVKLFDVIESLDRPKLARALAKEKDKQGRCPDCYIQVNTGEEEQKAGILPKDADAFIALCRDELNLPVIGLMCIPPVDEEPALHFALLRKIAERNGLSFLSMGMSGDYETAVAYGATSVRVGSAIFGTRPVKV
ncbi:YggS family pyridoxal phosphate-dependent enzyme [Rhodovibrionaceae bacterium A322]